MGIRQSRPWIVSDELWSLIEPLLPKPGPKKVEGRPQVPDRQALCGILFVLYTGIQWEYLPQELGFGSGHDLLAAPGRLERGRRLGPATRRAAEEAAVDRPVGLVAGGDRFLARAGRSARPKSGPSPVDRARPGSKHHVLTDGQGIPLAVSLTGGHRNDVTQLLPLLDKIPAVAGLVGRPRRRPDMLFADRGYDHDKYRRLLRARGIRPAIAERGQPHGTGLGIFRWVVERTISWLHGFRRLRIRWERRDDIHEAFLGLAACLITHRHVQRLC
ncbi:IS5 family transposase [Streptomyces sp. NPDC029674]|uniref:IS5 family transposase n=1 Tax=Streptomyces sp. NPDC029674 TaxID=3365297 RepID=UPI003850126E